MTSRWPLWASVSALVLTAAFYGIGLVLGSSRGPVVGIEPFSIADVVWPIPFVGFSLVGAIVAARRYENPVGWLFLGVGGVMLFNFFSGQYALAALGGRFTLGGGHLMAWFALWTWVPAVGILTVFFLLFPSGRPPSRNWDWVVAAVIVVNVAIVVAALQISPDLGLDLMRARTPGDLPQGEWLNTLANGGGVTLVLIAIASLVVRFWRSRGEERQQLKWLSFAGMLLGLALIVMFAFGGEDPISVPALAIANTVALLSIPVAAGISILRYRLYDIDLVINRTLVYGTLTALLALSYLGIVVLLQRLLTPIARDSDFAVAGSTLAVAALFRPLRAYVQSFIDRRFYRRRYDAAETLDAFSSRLREEVDLDSLSYELIGVVGSTMQPAHAGLWLRTQKQDALREGSGVV